MLMAFSSPDSSQNDFYFPFVLRGVGLAFMMSPILSLAVFGLRGKVMILLKEKVSVKCISWILRLVKQLLN